MGFRRGCAVFSILSLLMPIQSKGSTTGGKGSGHGVTIPLLAANTSDGPRLMAKVKPNSSQGDTASELVLVDTGSSALGLCNSSLKAELASLKTEYMTCNLYGSNPPNHGWWGYFYQGEICVESIEPLPNVYYSVMEQEKDFCFYGQGPGGIFGIAFKTLNRGTKQKPQGWGDGVLGTCPQEEQSIATPLIHTINQGGGVEKLGIYWSSMYGDGEANLYINDHASTNSHYVTPSKSAWLGELGWYDVIITSFSVDGQEFTTLASGTNISDFCSEKNSGNCIMDTGTPVMYVPNEVAAAVQKDKAQTFTISFLAKSSAAVEGSASHEAVQKEVVSLDFPVEPLKKNNWVSDADPSGQGAESNLIMGLPFWAFYYVLFDLTDSSMSFSKNPEAPGASVSASPDGQTNAGANMPVVV